jgi:hypothetical protein
MKTSIYIVTGKEGANLWVLPSSLSEKVLCVANGEKVQVVTDFSAVNTVGEKTTYLSVEKDGQFLWTAAGNLTAEVSAEDKVTAKKTTSAPTPITTKKVMKTVAKLPGIIEKNSTATL